MRYFLLFVILLSLTACGNSEIYTAGEPVVIVEQHMHGILLDVTREEYTYNAGRYGTRVVTACFAHVIVEYLDENMVKKTRVIVVSIDDISRPIPVPTTNKVEK